LKIGKTQETSANGQQGAQFVFLFLLSNFIYIIQKYFST